MGVLDTVLGENELVIRVVRANRTFGQKHSLLKELEVLKTDRVETWIHIEERTPIGITLTPGDVDIPAGAILHLRWVPGSKQQYDILQVLRRNRSDQI